MSIAKKAAASKRAIAILSQTELYSKCCNVAARSLPNSTSRWNFYVGNRRRAFMWVVTRDKKLVRDLAEAIAASVKREGL